MNVKTAIFGFIVPAATFALATVLDIVTDESNPEVILAFLIEAAVIIALPILNYRHEKALGSKITAKQYNTGYFLGYFLAAAAVMIFICSVDVGGFFTQHDGTEWLDLRGLGIIFLAFGIAGGFVFALIFRGIAALINHYKK